MPRLSRGRRKRAWYTPFAHALNYCRFLRHRRLPTTMLCNNINKLAAKLLSFAGLY